MPTDQAEKTINFTQLIILSYFKEYQINYSINKLAIEIGCSLSQTSEYIIGLITDGYLKYENNLLRLTLRGRNILVENDMDSFAFNVNNDLLFESKKMDTNEVYVIKDFSTKRWRGQK